MSCHKGRFLRNVIKHQIPTDQYESQLVTSYIDSFGGTVRLVSPHRTTTVVEVLNPCGVQGRHPALYISPTGHFANIGHFADRTFRRRPKMSNV